LKFESESTLLVAAGALLADGENTKWLQNSGEDGFWFIVSAPLRSKFDVRIQRHQPFDVPTEVEARIMDLTSLNN
jgi:hypothetical protein